jgi:hypothetical protein
MKILFLDESGDHDLAKIDPQYPIFVLGGIIVEQAYAEGELTCQLNAFKRALFGTENIILHTADITRNRNGFERLQDTAFRQRFYRELNELMATLDYAVVACAIHKSAHLARYGVAALDPYMLSLDILVERFCFEIGAVSKGGKIVAEQRDPTLDRALRLAWLNLKLQGTRYLQGKVIADRIHDIELRPKKQNIAGLQLADLVLSPIGRHVLGKEAREDWQVVQRKLRRGRTGQVEGFGLVILPK